MEIVVKTHEVTRFSTFVFVDRQRAILATESG